MVHDGPARTRGGFDLHLERTGRRLQARGELRDARGRRARLKRRGRFRAFPEPSGLDDWIEDGGSNQRAKKPWGSPPRETPVENRSRNFIRDRDMLGHLAWG